MKVYTHPEYDYVKVVEVPYDEIQSIDIDVCEQPRETLSHYYNRMTKKPGVLINAGFFNTKTAEACFSLVDDGEEISSHYGVKYGLGTLSSDMTRLVYGIMDDGTDWHDFIAGYPVLVNNRVPITSVSWGSEINYNALRTCIGYTDECIIIVAVSKPGMKFIPLANLLADLKCIYAINLDGGGSSRLVVDGVVVNTPTENRSVDSVLAIYLKDKEVLPEADPIEEEPYISYTVKSGDSLWKIATYYYGKGSMYKDIVEFNELKSNVLRVGQDLKIPVDAERYTIVSGDTLWKIAATKLGSGLKYKYLAEYNDIDPAKPIVVGQIIFIPV